MSTLAPSKVTVSVTQEHIDHGLPGECHQCAIALAVLDTIPGAQEVRVRYWDHDGDDAREPEVYVTVDFGPDEKHRYFTLPDEAAGWVPRFDDGLPVSPMTFEMTERQPWTASL